MSYSIYRIFIQSIFRFSRFNCIILYFIPLVIAIQLQDTKGQLRARDQRTVELETETEMLKEQQVRQNSIIASLRNRIKV